MFGAITRFWLLLGLALSFGAVPAAAWDVIATRQAGNHLSHDVIMVPGNSTFTRLKFCALKSSVRVQVADIRFKSGQRQHVPPPGFIDANDCSHPVDLRGLKRDIVSIRLAYMKASPGKRRAILQVLAE